MSNTKHAVRGLPIRQPTTATYDVLIADSAEVADAVEAVRKSEVDIRFARLSKDEATMAQAETAKAEAAARLSACTERLTFQEITPVELEALHTAFPFPEADELEALGVDYQWPLIHALAAASCIDHDATAEEWAKFTAGWSLVNWRAFAATVQSAQQRTATAGLSFG